MNYVLKWVESGTVTNHMKITKIRAVVKCLIQLVDVLGKGIGASLHWNESQEEGGAHRPSSPWHLLCYQCQLCHDCHSGAEPVDSYWLFEGK